MSIVLVFLELSRIIILGDEIEKIFGRNFGVVFLSSAVISQLKDFINSIFAILLFYLPSNFRSRDILAMPFIQPKISSFCTPFLFYSCSAEAR